VSYDGDRKGRRRILHAGTQKRINLKAKKKKKKKKKKIRRPLKHTYI
jgi:hypothetical protein